MITVSDQFLKAVRAPHGVAYEVTCQPADGSPEFELPFLDGTITIDRTAVHRRRLDITLSDPTLYPSGSSAPFNVYGSTITASRGIRFANSLREMVQLGIYRIEDAARDLPA